MQASDRRRCYFRVVDKIDISFWVTSKCGGVDASGGDGIVPPPALLHEYHFYVSCFISAFQTLIIPATVIDGIYETRLVCNVTEVSKRQFRPKYRTVAPYGPKYLTPMTKVSYHIFGLRWLYHSFIRPYTKNVVCILLHQNAIHLLAYKNRLTSKRQRRLVTTRENLPPSRPGVTGLLVISPTRHLAYWTVRLLDISPTAWTVRLQIAHFAYKTAGIKSDV